MKDRLITLLRWSERYTKTDMVYLFHGSFWMVVSQAAAMAMSLALAIAFGHLASPDTYGNYRYVLSLWGLCTALSLSGIGTAVTQSVARGYEGSLQQGFWLNMKWSLGVVFAALGAAVYYYFYAHNAFLGVSLAIVALFAPFLSSFSLFDAFLVGQKDFRRDSLYNACNGVIPVLALIACLFLTHRAIIFVLVFFAANAATDAVTYFLALRRAKNASVDPELFRYSAHLSLMGIISTVADKVDSAIVFILLGPVQLAVYAYAIAMPEQIKQVLKMVSPLAMSKFANRSIAEIRASIWPRIGYLALITTATLLLYILAAPFLFHWLFPIYAGAVNFSRFYALTLLVGVISIPLGTVLQAHKKVREQYLSSISSSTILLVVLPTLTYYYGIMGALLGQLVYRFCATGILLFFFVRLKDTPPI